MTIDWQGVYPAATTHFNADGSMNLESTMKHLEAMIESGIHGLVMLGTVGENCSLEYNEKLDVLRATVEQVNGRIPVITGVAEYTTKLACRFSNDAKAAGLDGLMVLPGMVYKSDSNETVQHFRSVAQSMDLPVMCYNNPISYGVDMNVREFEQLADIDNIVAIKESSEDVRRITDLYNAFDDRYVIFCGVDDLALEAMVLGASGWISGLVNAFPRENRLLWDLMKAGQYEKAVEVYRWYTPLLHLDTLPKLVQYIKLAQQECGFGAEHVRAPRLNLAGTEREEILKIIRDGIAKRPKIENYELEG
jgi:4-hydroxy-tetrahydrodipicolinate synthase